MGRAVIVIGAGGHARVLLDTLMASSGARVIGLADVDAGRRGETVNGVPILGDDDWLLKTYSSDEVVLVNGIGSTRETGPRRRVFESFKARGFSFERVVHPAAILSANVEFGEGVQVMAGAVVQIGAILGDDAIVNTGAVVDHDCRIGAHSHVAPGAVISGGVEVGEGAHIGTGAAVIQGVRIGRGALVGAGAVVIRDVADGAVVYGVPARQVAP